MSNNNFKSIGSNVTIYPSAKIIGAENLSIGNNVIIDDFVMIQASKPAYIGNNVHIASFTSITGGGEFIIEDFSTLSSGVRFFTGTDDFFGNGLANSTIPDSYRNVLRSKTVMKKHTIIGANSVILPGVEIPEGTAIGALSLVRKNLDPWKIYGGNPLKLLGDRNKHEILKLEAAYLSSMS